MPVAVNPTTGEVTYWDGSAWSPAKIAENPDSKERFAWDGSIWKSLGKTPSGFGAALSSGVDTLQQALYSAGEGGAKSLGLEGLAKFAGEGAARNKAEALKALPNQQSFSEAESLGDYFQAAKEGLGTSLPQMAPAVVAGALSGGTLGSVGGPLGTGIGAVIGGAAAGIPQFYGYNRERQKEESGAVQSEGAALLAAVPQAAMDSLLGKLFPGAGRAVTGGLLTRVVKKGAMGTAIEVPTEVGQQLLERFQAGLPIDDEQALAEYKEAAIAAGVLGGGLGGASGAFQKRAMSSDELARLAGRTEDDQLAQNIEDARAGLTPTPPPAAVDPAATAVPDVTVPPGAAPAPTATAPDATVVPVAPVVAPDLSATAPEPAPVAAANVAQKAPPTFSPSGATILTYTPEQFEAYVEALPSNVPIDAIELAKNMGADPNAVRDMLENHPRMTRQKGSGIYMKDMEMPPAPDLPDLEATAAPEAAPAPAVKPAATDDFNELPPPPTSEEIRQRYGEIGNEEPAAPAPALRKGTAEDIRQKIAAMPLGASLKPNIIAEQLKADGISVVSRLVADVGQTMGKQGFLGRPNARVSLSRTAKPYVSAAEAKAAKAAAAQATPPAAIEPSSEEVVDPADFAPAQPEPVASPAANPLPAERRAAAQARTAAQEAATTPAEKRAATASATRPPPVPPNKIADVANQYIANMAPGDTANVADLAREMNVDTVSFWQVFEDHPNLTYMDMGNFLKAGEQAAPVVEAVPQEVQPEAVVAPVNPLPAERRAATANRTKLMEKLKPAAPVVEENLPDEEIDFDEHFMMKEHESRAEDAINEIGDTENTTQVRALAKKLLKRGMIDEDGMSSMEDAIDDAERGEKFDAAQSALEDAINENTDNTREDVEERIREYEENNRPAVEEVVSKPAGKKAGKPKVAPKPSEATAPEIKAEPEATPVDRVAEIKKAAEAVKAKQAAAKAETTTEQAAPEEVAPDLTERERLVLDAINRAPLGTNSRISLPQVQRILQESSNQSEDAIAASKMKASDIKAMLPTLLEKGVIQTDPTDANFFQRKQKTRAKAAAAPAVPKTRAKRREATARKQATENLDQPKTVNAAVDQKPAKKTKAVPFAEILSKEKNPDSRLIQLLELGPVEADMSFEDFAKEIQRVIKDKLASTPEGEPLFDATALVNARDEIEALETEDGDTIEQAQKLLADAIENTAELLPPAVRADIKQAWAEEKDTGPEIKGEMTDAQKLKKRFNDLHESRSLSFEDVNKLVRALIAEKRFDPKSEYWTIVQPEIQGSTNPREYLEKFEKKFYGDKSAASKKATTEGKTKKQIANDKIDALYDEDGKVNGPEVAKLADEFVKDGLLTPELAAGVKGYIKSGAAQAAAKLNGAVNTGELSTRSATAPETEAAPEAAAAPEAEAKEKTKKKRTKRRKGKGKKKSAAAPKTEETVEPPTPKTPEEIAAIEERRVAAQKFLDDRLAQMEASGPFGQKAAAAVREVLANGDISHVQAHHAFMMAEISSKLLKGTGANPDIKFLNNVDYNGRRLRKGHPDALAGLIEFSLNDNPEKNVLGYSKETAAHEPFHVLQDLMEEYDPATSKILFGTRTGIDPETGHGIYKGGAFRDGMTPKDIPSSIRRTLEALSPDASGESYWSKFTQDYNNAPETPALDADGNPIPNLRTEFGKQREAMAYVFGMLADAKSRGFNTNAMDAPFKRFLRFLTQFREKMGNFLRGKGYESTDQVLEDYISGERQQGYGGEVERSGASEFSGRSTVEGEFSVRGGRLSKEAELAIRGAQAQSVGRNLTTSNRTMNTLKKAFDHLALIQDRKRYMIMRYLAMGNDQALQEEAKGFYDKISALPKSQQDTIYSYLTTRGAIAPNLPPQIKKLAIDVKTRINSIGDRMVQRRMISKESLAEYKDQYLPRIYMKYLMEGKLMSGTGLRAGPQGQLKQRKDFSEQDRVAMGEVTNPGFLSYMALYRPERDMVMLDFLNNIANASDVDWVWPQSLINYKGMKVTSFWLVDEATAIRQRMKLEPDNKKRAEMKRIAKEMQDLADPHIGELAPENYKQLPKSARYGALKGMVVRSEIYDDIVGAAEINPDANFIDRTFGDKNSTLAKGTAFWKMTKTILNPPTQVRNFISNAVMLSLSGVSPFMVGPRILQAIKAMRNNEKAWQVAKQYGVQGAGFGDNELTIAQDIMEEFLANNKTGIMNPAIIGRVFATIATKAGNAYQWSEHVFKTAKIIDELEKNKVSSIRDKATRERAEGEAALEGHKWFFDYSLVPPSIKSLRTMPFGAPFITYYYKALPLIVEVLSNPRTAMRFAPYIAMQMAMPAMVASMYDADDEDVDKIKMALSEHLRENGSINIVPFKDQNDNWQFLDWGYFFPWQMFVNTGKALATGDVAGALGSIGALSSPALSAVTAIKTNIDPFSGREIINKADPPNEQMTSFLQYIAQLALPPFVTSTGALGKAYETLTNSGVNKYGEPNQDGIQIAARLFGFNFYPVVPEMQRARNIGVMQRDLNDVIGRMNMVASDQSIPEDEREPKLDSYREEIEKRAAALTKYAEDSDVPGFLLEKEE
jgi:hypothetical protein